MNYVVESFNTYSGNTTKRFFGSLLECRKYLLDKAETFNDGVIQEQDLDGFTYENPKVSIYFSIRPQGRGEDLSEII